jgi:hypothetical protein
MTEIFNFLQQRAQRSVDRLRRAPEFRDMFLQEEAEEELRDSLQGALDCTLPHPPPSNVCDAIIKVLVDYAASEGAAGLSLLQRLGYRIHLHALTHRPKDRPDAFADWFVAGVPPEWRQLELMQCFEPENAGDSDHGDDAGDSGRGGGAGAQDQRDGGDADR